MAPGPASSGVASGKTARSSLRCASAPSEGVSLNALDGRANTMSSEIMSRMIPPAVCSAEIVTPSCRSIGPPASVAAARINVAIATARTAILRRSATGTLGVNVANTTAASMGPTVAKKVVKLVSAAASMASVPIEKDEINEEAVYPRRAKSRGNLLAPRNTCC